MSTFGEELRRERELREITLREVSHATKISLRYLEAMERNDFAYLPGGIFNRGFVRAYCQFIGVDSESMVNAYLLEERVQASAEGKPRREDLLRGPVADVADKPASAGPAVRRWVLVGLAVGLLALSVWAYLRFFAAEAVPEPPGETAGEANVGRPEVAGASTEGRG